MGNSNTTAPRARRQPRPQRYRRTRFEWLELRHLLQGVPGGIEERDVLPLIGLSSFGFAEVANQSLTTSDQPQQMPSVAVDPWDDRHVVVAYMDYSLSTSGYAGIGVAVSRDGGESWELRTIPLPEPFAQGAANPMVKFDGQGHLFVSYMAATFLRDLPPITNPSSGPPRVPGFESNNGIFVNRSNDGGLSWLPATAVAANLFDDVHRVPFEVIPSLAIDGFASLPDGRPNPLFGALYVTWGRYYPAGLFPGQPDAQGGSDAMIARSTDGGQTWQILTKTLPEGDVVMTVLEDVSNEGRSPPEGYGFINWIRPTVGPEGDIYVSMFVGTSFYVSHSGDGGVSFEMPTQVDSYGLPFGLGPRGLDFGLSSNRFRTQPVRAIAADPTRPGHVYAAEPLYIADSAGGVLDHAQIVFSSSDDYGQTWTQAVFPINDDNARVQPTGSPDDVLADQVMVSLSVGVDGTVALVWLDTRVDPANHLLNVYGCVSRDGGQTFGPNFRISQQSFDAEWGSFRDATGQANIYFGDSIGLAVAGQSAYVAWTDTSSRNQDIHFSNVPLNPIPVPLNDRFEPNDQALVATQLGATVKKRLPGLNLIAGDDDWFAFSSLASGELKVLAESDRAVDLQFDLFDGAGQQVFTQVRLITNAAGTPVAKELVAPTESGESYLLRVHGSTPNDSASDSIAYALNIQSLTADLETAVFREVEGQLSQDDDSYYLVKMAATGSLQIDLSSAMSTAELELIDPLSHEVMASGSGPSLPLNLPVQKGQELLIHVTTGAETGGVFHFTLTNLDQYRSPNRNNLQFPAGTNPSQEAVADFNRDGVADVALANAGTNTVSILLGDGQGLFSAPRQFTIGAFRLPNPVGDDFNLSTFRREIVTGDFDEDGLVDLAITNYDSADVSILLGRGDGSFKPQRRYDATAAPYGMTVGDVNNDGHLDLLAIDAIQNGLPNIMAVLLGRGDGSFVNQQLSVLPEALPEGTPALADLDGDGNLDMILGGAINNGLDVFRGDGEGNFQFFGSFPGTRQATDLLVTDVDGDGHLDVLATSLSVENSIYLLRGIGDATFAEPELFFTGQSPIALQLVDWGSAVELEDGSVVLGPRDGHLDVAVANSGVVTAVGQVPSPGIVILPALLANDGRFQSFSDPIQVATAKKPLDLKVADFNRDGISDLGIVDVEEFLAIYGSPPAPISGGSLSTARDLGTVVHFVQPTATITPQQHDAWYRIQTPREALPGSLNEVLDISGGFANQHGAGLSLQVADAAGNIRASGERVRVLAKQGEDLFIRIFANSSAGGIVGAGAYTLAIVTLPQVALVEAHSLLPGFDAGASGPVTSLVLVLQGDRLEPTAATNPANYIVTWLGSDELLGTQDDQRISLGSGTHPVVYDESSNVDIASGLSYPTAIRQTVTLLFDAALPAGSYAISVSSEVVAAEFSLDEMALLSEAPGLAGHPLVSVNNGEIEEGVHIVTPNLVQSNPLMGDFGTFEQGTRFLTQFHNDLGALLDAQLTAAGDTAAISLNLLNHIVARFEPALGREGERLVSMAVIFLDPVSIGLIDPAGRSFTYNLQTSAVAGTLPQTFVEVGGNVEVIVIPNPTGNYLLSVSDVGAHARGGWVLLGNQPPQVHSLTDSLRAGATQGAIRQFILPLGSSSAGTNVVGTISVGLALSQSALARAAESSVLVSGLTTARFDPLSNSLQDAFFGQLAGSASLSGELGSGGSLRSENVAEEIWDSLSDLWDRLNRTLRGILGEQNKVQNDLPAEADNSPLEQVWRVFTDLLGVSVKQKPNAKAANIKVKGVPQQPAADQSQREVPGNRTAPHPHIHVALRPANPLITAEPRQRVHKTDDTVPFRALHGPTESEFDSTRSQTVITRHANADGKTGQD